MKKDFLEAKALNKIMLIGRCATEPTDNRTDYARFRLAVSNHYKTRAGEKRENVEYFNIVAFGTIASRVTGMIRVGTTCYVEGRLQSQKYQDKNNVNRTSYSVICNAIQIVKDGADITQHSNNQTQPYEARTPEIL